MYILIINILIKEILTLVFTRCRSGTRTPIPSSRGMCPTIRRTGNVFYFIILPQKLKKTIENRAFLRYNRDHMSEENKSTSEELNFKKINNNPFSNREDKDIEQKLDLIKNEFRQGINLMKKSDNSVTFYGGARFDESHKVYGKVKNLSYRIAKELGYTVISGGGGGVMEAASRGAYEAGGNTIGLTIKLPHEQKSNKYLKEEVSFNYFFARQVSLSYSTEVCIFCPGGFGTLFELFEILTIKQTKKVGDIPIILFGSRYWKPLQRFIRKVLLKRYKTINKDESSIYIITDDEDKIIEIIKNSKIRNGEDSL